MRKETSIYIMILISLIVIGAFTAIAFHIRNLLEINVRGVVEVKPSTMVVDVELNVDSKEGVKVVNLSSLNIPTGNITIKKKLSSYEGNFTLILNGELLLNSNTHNYSIKMPCLLDLGGQCFRILMLIPGYDIPLRVEGGYYNLTLVLKWNAEGSGKFDLKLLLEFSE